MYGHAARDPDMIPVLAYIAMGFLGIRALVVLVNFLFQHRLPNPGGKAEKMLSILIPARNEEKNIGRILDCILKQDYKDIEVWVCNDHSTDGTQAILEEYSKAHPGIGWFQGRELPPGWTGKNFACHQLAERANGHALLFVDADMEIHEDLLTKMLEFMNKRNLALLSIFPKQLLVSRGEQATVPVMNWILLSLLPLPMVTYGLRSSFSAANGQFMMFRANVYHKLQPHSIVRSSAVEDIEIMTLLKKAHYRCATLLGDHRVQCRMYHNYREAIAGFSKNVLHFFSGSLPWALFYIFFTTFGLMLIALWSLPFFLAALSVALTCRVLISLMSRQHVFRNLVMVPLQHFSFLWMVEKSLVQKSRGSLSWKGREISLK
jgi:glycosyltransferase involved in cell wall biosynthesis